MISHRCRVIDKGGGVPRPDTGRSTRRVEICAGGGRGASPACAVSVPRPSAQAVTTPGPHGITRDPRNPNHSDGMRAKSPPSQGFSAPRRKFLQYVQYNGVSAPNPRRKFRREATRRITPRAASLKWFVPRRLRRAEARPDAGPGSMKRRAATASTVPARDRDIGPAATSVSTMSPRPRSDHQALRGLL